MSANRCAWVGLAGRWVGEGVVLVMVVGVWMDGWMEWEGRWEGG